MEQPTQAVFKLPWRVPERGWDATKTVTTNSPTQTNPKPVCMNLDCTREMTKQEGLSFVTIYHNNNPVYALLDSGSTISLAGPKLFRQFPYLMSRLQQCEEKGLTVCDSAFVFSGKINFMFTMGNKDFTVTLKYLDTMPYPVLLGSDFLNSAGVSLNFKEGIITIPERMKVSVKQGRLIKPQRSALIQGALDQKVDVDVVGVVMPCLILKDLITDTLMVQVSRNDPLVLI